MGRISSETKRIVKDYYNQKIKDKYNEQKKIDDKFVDEYFKKFNNDEDVKQARKLLEKINKKYSLNEKVELYRYRIDYEKSEEHKKIDNEISEIKKECNTLLVILENFPLKSKEYIEGIIKVKEIMEG